MSLTLGEKLRQAREERGISISEVAEQTRISSLYLESIEKDDYKPLPGGIFNKGFVKSYAKFIGIDEHEALQDYSKIVMQTEGGGEPELKVYRSEVLTDDRTNGSMIPTLIFAVIILALMTGGILFLVNYLQNQPATPQNTATNTNMAGDTDVAGHKEQTSTVPSFETIELEFTANREPIALTLNIDGKPQSDNVAPGTPKIINAKENIRLSYYRGFADMVDLKLNGKAVKPPAAPARGNSITYEITKANAAQIWERGQIDEEPVATSSATTSAPIPTVTTPTVTTAVATPTPAAAQTPAATPIKATPTATPVAKPTAPKPTPTAPGEGTQPTGTP